MIHQIGARIVVINLQIKRVEHQGSADRHAPLAWPIRHKLTAKVNSALRARVAHLLGPIEEHLRVTFHNILTLTSQMEAHQSNRMQLILVIQAVVDAELKFGAGAKMQGQLPVAGVYSSELQIEKARLLGEFWVVEKERVRRDGHQVLSSGRVHHCWLPWSRRAI